MGAFKPSASVLLPTATTNAKTVHKTLIKQKLAAEKAKLKQVQANLKAQEKKVAQKIKERQQKEKAKAIAKEKKITQEATKTYRLLGLWPYYIKTFFTPDTDFKQLSQKYKNLSQDEKDKLQQQLDNYNKTLRARYPPKPKLPPLGYPLFVKQNFPAGASPEEAFTQLAAKWKTLTPEEKEAYVVYTDAEKEAHAKAVREWTELRIKNYLEDQAGKK